MNIYCCVVLCWISEVAKFCIAKNKRLVNAFPQICIPALHSLSKDQKFRHERCKYRNFILNYQNFKEIIVSKFKFYKTILHLLVDSISKGTARQTLLPMTLFTESSINGNSTPPLKMINQTINTLSGFSCSLSSLTDHNVYCYAVNGKRMEKCISVRNRLLK